MPYNRIDDWKKHLELGRLDDLSNPPKQLFYSGTWDLQLFTFCTAVIGSRKMTEYGRRVVESIVPQLVFEGKTIISGFMYGVDQYAHQVCIEYGGKTIAVLGWGIQRELDPADELLAESIIESGGLLLSEWENQQPTLWTFPVRNRIVAALSDEVIVIEAAVKSGSLITAGIAHTLKRKLWAVPGQVTSPLSAGTNMLIAEGKAGIWQGKRPVSIGKSNDPIMSLLESEDLSANDIARKLGKSVSEVGAQLSLLSLTGKLTERGGRYYVGKN